MLVLLGMMLTACSSANNEARHFSVADIDPEDVAERMVDAIGGQGDYMEADDDVYDFYFGESEGYPLLDDACMMLAREETNVGELGVFEAEREEDAQVVYDMVRKYFDDRTEGLRAFAANYSPEDLAKIDNAGIATYGKYVVYYILNEAEQAAAIGALEDALGIK